MLHRLPADLLSLLLARTEPGDPWFGPHPTLEKCQEGLGGVRCRFGYVRVSFRIPGLGGRHRWLSTHILTFILSQAGPMTLDELFLAYLEVRESGLQCDHMCENTSCRRPSHLQLLTQSENIRAQKERDAARAATRPRRPEPTQEELDAVYF